MYMVTFLPTVVRMIGVQIIDAVLYDYDYYYYYYYRITENKFCAHVGHREADTVF